MAYSEKLFRMASDEIAGRKRRAEEEAEKHHREFALKCPELLDLEAQMQKSAFGLIKIIGMGEKSVDYIEKLRKQNIEAQSEIVRMLKIAGYPQDYLEPKYTCSLCSDTGIRNGKLCSCHIELLKQLSYEQLCRNSPLKLSSFSEFDLSYYKDDSNVYELMSRNFEFCKNYADGFDFTSQSLLMRGETGLGKTHLSLAIAGELLNKGFGVVYGSVQNLFSNIEREHFGRADEPDGTTEKMLLECDLLILDDLGAEFTTSFVVSTLNNVVNTRLLSSKPTIISTNLKVNELDDRYSRRITSRILGEYQLLTFGGKDVRQQKKFK